MANVKSGKIIGTGDYINIENELNLNLTENTIYSVQIQGKAVVCEKSTKPSDGEGYYIKDFKVFGYKKEQSFLWVRVNNKESAFINISE